MNSSSHNNNYNLAYQSNESFRGYDNFSSANDSVIKQIKNFALTEWTTWDIAVAVIFIIAVIGNSLALYISCRKTYRNNACMLYLAALSVAYTFATLRLALYIINYLIFPNLLYTSSVVCKLVTFFDGVADFMSSWLVVVIAVERAFSAKLPHKVTRISSRRFGRKTVSIIACGAFVLCSHYLYGITSVPILSANICYAQEGIYRIFYNDYWPSLIAIFYSWLPCIILIVANTVMIKAVVASVTFRDSALSIKRRGRNRDLTIVAILVSLCFIVLTTPWPLYSSVIRRLGIWEKYTEYVIELTLGLLLHFNKGTIFFLYIISGSRFRQDLKDIICFNSAENRYT